MNRSRLLRLANSLEGRDENLQVIVDFRGGPSPRMDQEIADALGVPVRPFTASIDAALSLTDRERYDYQEGFVDGHVGGTPYAKVGIHEYADTPALALCAASLRAIADAPRFVYAIGHKDDLGSYGMFFGPTERLQSCLDFVPDEHEQRGVCYVIEFDNAATSNRIVARWVTATQTWRRRT